MMDTKHFWKAIAFAIVVTLAMNALDMLFHVATDTVVHLNYVAVKATIIFTTVFLIAFVIGLGKTPGIVTSLLGPIAFYIYYSFATPTLDRSMFTIDDAVWYILVHGIALGISYYLVYKQMMKEDERLPFAIISALATLPLHWGWMMFIVRLAGGNELSVLSFGLALVVLAILFVLTYLASLLKSWWPYLISGLVFGGMTLLFGAALLDAGVRFVTFSVISLIAYSLRGAE